MLGTSTYTNPKSTDMSSPPTGNEAGLVGYWNLTMAAVIQLQI